MLARHIFRTNFLNMFLNFHRQEIFMTCAAEFSLMLWHKCEPFLSYMHCAVFIGISEISYMQCPLEYHHKYNVFFHRDINRPIVRFDLGSQVLTDFLSQQFSYSKDCLDFGKKMHIMQKHEKKIPQTKKHDTVTLR